ncbi:MAG: REP-associated tyrosine transposase [Limisphaerales bacterium]
MNDRPPPPRQSRPPYNRALQELIVAKQTWSGPLDDEAKLRGFAGWHQRGYLPHRDQPGLRQFLTFRLADAMPASRRSEWEHCLSLESRRERRRQIESYLDPGRGQCWLRQPAIAELTESALRFFDRKRYRLVAWVVMPNHVHVLVETWQTPLDQLVQSWKRFVAREANKLLQRQGSFWERDYWDTYLRDDEHLLRAIRYIETNPVTAHLARTPKEWPWSSARFRDDTGALCLTR